MTTLRKKFDQSDRTRMQAIFAMLFILQNRLQTAGDKLLDGITMKQWLLLAVTGISEQPPTLTSAGELMGCSRQNVKKLAVALERKGLLELRPCQVTGNAICIFLTPLFRDHLEKHSDRQRIALNLLFEEFQAGEIEQLYHLFEKLDTGVSNVETFVREQKLIKNGESE